MTPAKYLLLSAVCLSVSYIAFGLIFKNETRFHQQRIFLLASLILSVILPLTGLRIDFAEFYSRGTGAGDTIRQITAFSGQPLSITEEPGFFNRSAGIFIGMYLIVTSIFLTSIIIQFLRILRLYITSKKTRHEKGIILSSSKIKSSFSFFGWIFIPEGISDNEERESIIIHESIHVSQYHSVDNLLMGLASAVMWFNPAVWMMKNSFQLIHEYLADEGTISTGIDRIRYQALLINQAAEERLVSLTSSFNTSLIRKRMIMMEKIRNKKRSGLKIMALLPHSILLLVMVALVNGLLPRETKAAHDSSVTIHFQKDTITQTKIKDPGFQQDTTKNSNVKTGIAENGDKTRTGETAVTVYGVAKHSEPVNFIVDGRKVNDVKDIDPETIESIEVLKDDNLILIRTKSYEKTQDYEAPSRNIKTEVSENVLYIIDGKVAGKNEFENIEAGQIESVYVIKGRDEVKKYTSLDYEGVIRITTKAK